MTEAIAPETVLDYWYGPAMAPHWFSSTPAIDADIRERFEGLWRRVAAGELDAWADSPEGALALAIVLDQFPLNMYRGRAESFATEQRAVAVAKAAVARGFHLGLAPERRLFLFMPLMHSEAPDDQDLSVSLFQSSGLDGRWPEHHRGIVRRFGRFPHRNAILGRESTPEELAYLASDAAFKG